MIEIRDLGARYRGALIGVAVGDAFGAPFEGRSRLEAERLSRMLTATVPLRYTDDTRMTMGLARSLIERRGFDGPHLVETFATDFESEPWRGYGPGPPRVFAAIRRGVGWERAARVLFDGAGSFGNGAAMRVAPAALFGCPDVDAVAWLAHRSALVTHSHALGIDGARLQACAIALLLVAPRRRPFDRTAFLEQLCVHAQTREMRDGLESIAVLPGGAGPEEVVSRLGNGVEAHRSVPTALHCFLRSPDSFVDTVAFSLAVGFGGDTDTIASMAGALSGAYLGEHEIPDPWLERVEGISTLRSLADALLAVAARNVPKSEQAAPARWQH